MRTPSLLLASFLSFSVSGCFFGGGGGGGGDECDPGQMLINEVCALMGIDTQGDAGSTGLDLTDALGMVDENGMPVIFMKFANVFPPPTAYAWTVELDSVDGDQCSVSASAEHENGTDSVTVGGNAGATQNMFVVEPIGDSGLILRFDGTFSYHADLGGDFRLRTSVIEFMGATIDLDDLPEPSEEPVPINDAMEYVEAMNDALVEIFFSENAN